MQCRGCVEDLSLIKSFFYFILVLVLKHFIVSYIFILDLNMKIILNIYKKNLNLNINAIH